MSASKVLVTGAGGYVASHVISQLAEAKIGIRALLHSPRRAQILQTLGCEVSIGDVRDRMSLEQAFNGVGAVIHLVGIIREKGSATFESVVTEGTRNIVELARKKNVKIIYNSALNAESQATNPYLRTKGQAEELVRDSGQPFTIFRCPYIYGPGSSFVNLLANLVRFPIVPIFGPGTQKMQPVFASDLAYCIVKAVNHHVADRSTVDMVGPDVVTYDELIDLVAKVFGKRIRKVHLPLWLAQALIAVGQSALIAKASAPVLKRLFKDIVGVIAEEAILVPLITPLELELLQLDLRGDASLPAKLFGFTPTSLAEGLMTVRASVPAA